MQKNTYVDCGCKSPEHVVRFSFERENFPDLTIHVQMSPYAPFWKRVFEAVKYVLGIDSPVCHWDSTCVSPQDAKKIRNLCDDYILTVGYPKG